MSNKILFNYTLNEVKKTLSQDDLKLCLKNLGCKKDDTICIHSQLFAFGVGQGKKDEFLQNLLEVFLDFFSDGTILMPTFSYSFCKGEDFDIKNTPADKNEIGIFSEYFRTYPSVIRTQNPIFSFAIWGRNKEKFLSDNNCKSCFGSGCVYDVLKNLNGKILAFGTKNRGWTFYHYIEEKAILQGIDIDYRYFKDFDGYIINENEKYYKKIKYFVRNNVKYQWLKYNAHYEDFLLKQDFWTFERFGRGEILCVDAKKMFDKAILMLHKNNHLLENITPKFY